MRNELIAAIAALVSPSGFRLRAAAPEAPVSVLDSFRIGNSRDSLLLGAERRDRQGADAACSTMAIR